MASPFPYRPDFLQVDYEVKSNEASNVGSLFLAVVCDFLTNKMIFTLECENRIFGALEQSHIVLLKCKNATRFYQLFLFCPP